eukprot:1151976-Pelagomonas_calceolata.AAC.6
MKTQSGLVVMYTKYTHSGLLQTRTSSAEKQAEACDTHTHTYTQAPEAKHLNAEEAAARAAREVEALRNLRISANPDLAGRPAPSVRPHHQQGPVHAGHQRARPDLAGWLSMHPQCRRGKALAHASTCPPYMCMCLFDPYMIPSTVKPLDQEMNHDETRCAESLRDNCYAIRAQHLQMQPWHRWLLSGKVVFVRTSSCIQGALVYSCTGVFRHEFAVAQDDAYKPTHARLFFRALCSDLISCHRWTRQVLFLIFLRCASSTAADGQDKPKLATKGDKGARGRTRFGPGRLQQDVDDVFNSFGAEILYEDVEAAVSVWPSFGWRTRFKSNVL